MGQRNRKELIQILQKQGRSTELESLLGNAEIAIIAQHQANLALSYHRVAWPPSPTAHWPLEHHHAPHLAGERRSRFASDGLPSMCDHATHTASAGLPLGYTEILHPMRAGASAGKVHRESDMDGRDRHAPNIPAPQGLGG